MANPIGGVFVNEQPQLADLIRQQRIVDLAEEGWTSSDISRQLQLSDEYVKIQ
jgi:DNA-binding NarL/FixJ family response regulator